MAENNSSAPLKTAGEPFVALGECIADQVCLSVAELPDRNSPPDWPQAMLVTSDELRTIVLNAINYAAQETQAAPAPITFMAEDEARDFAWKKVREDLSTEGWTVMDSVNFHGFFMWGWRYRAQYELQRTAMRSAVMQEIRSAAPAAVAVPEFDEWITREHPHLGPIGDGVNIAREAWHAGRAALAATPEPPATDDSSAGDLAEVPDGFGSAEHWKEKAQYWAGVAHELRGQALRGEPVDGIIQPTSQAEVQAEPVIYVSRGQLETHTDPDSDGGRYLPARRTPLGLLNYPLYSAPQAQPGDALTKAARDALAERARQINVEGWTPEHDDEHRDGSLSIAAACYALTGLAGSRPGALSPHYLAAWVGWGEGWFKPSSRRRNLEKAIALLIADMERLDRAAMAAAQEGGKA